MRPNAPVPPEPFQSAASKTKLCGSGFAQFVNVNYLYLFGSLFQNAYGAKGKAKAP